MSKLCHFFFCSTNILQLFFFSFYFFKFLLDDDFTYENIVNYQNSQEMYFSSPTDEENYDHHQHHEQQEQEQHRQHTEPFERLYCECGMSFLYKGYLTYHKKYDCGKKPKQQQRQNLM